MVERHSKRSSVPAFEFLETLENICETAFTKNEFGVKQHEGKKYLFGPGVIDHIPDKGFGQMGMGDYDKRIQAYCRMFIEDVGEEELHRLFVKDGFLDKTKLCEVECRSTASGTGAPPSERRAKRRKTRPPPSTTETPPRVLFDPPPPQPAVTPAPAPKPKSPRQSQKSTAAKDASGRTASAAGPASVEEAIALLPRLSAMQLRWLVDAGINELVKRASAAEAASDTR